jgi:hypothetical protein
VSCSWTLFDVVVHQLRASSTGSRESISRPIDSRPPALDVDELTIVTSWAEAVTRRTRRRLRHDRARRRPGAAWRGAMQLIAPSPDLRAALATLQRVVREASTPDHTIAR